METTFSLLLKLNWALQQPNKILKNILRDVFFCNMDTRSIGIFDSGVGGLTVASAISEKLPNENLIYFGDTLHLPYGEKSPESIQRYATQIADFLISEGCKIIVIACNSASATAFESTKTHIHFQVPVLDVIQPMVSHVKNYYPGKRVGVVGTKATIKADVYAKQLNKYATVTSKATPLLAHMIEEGFIHDDVSKAVIASYLNTDYMKSLDALILGCTHYPLIKKDFETLLPNTHILDSSAIVADEVSNVLTNEGLLNSQTSKGKKAFYVSDHTDWFSQMAKAFFGEELNLQEQKL